MDRDKAFEELKLRLENEDNIRHSLDVEAIMRKLAEYLHEDTELWGLAGLVHDIDIERIHNHMSLHGKMGGDILETLDFDKTIVYAVRANNPLGAYERRRKIDKALFCACPMASLIKSCTAGISGEKLGEVDDALVLKRYHSGDFAPETERDRIMSCADLGLSLEKFADLSLKTMKGIVYLHR